MICSAIHARFPRAGIQRSPKERHAYINVGDENSGSIGLYYEDHGSGAPVVLIHGYPLSGRAWDKQVSVLLDAGRRVITYDRRGFGKSSQPTAGYDYDTFAADLDVLMDKLDLRDATLVGHSMGTGEVTRYLGTYGSKPGRQGRTGVPDPAVSAAGRRQRRGTARQPVRRVHEGSQADVPAWMKGFLDNFTTSMCSAGPSSATRHFRQAGTSRLARRHSRRGCIPTWETDFRQDLPKIDVPVLVVQGDADRILPFDKDGEAPAGPNQ